MLLYAEFFGIAALVAILIMLLSQERAAAKKNVPHAAVEEYWDGTERRQYARFDHELTVDYYLDNKYHPPKAAKTVDISEGGLKLLLQEKLAVGSLVQVRIALPHPRSVIGIKAEVAWSQESDRKDGTDRRLFRAGLRFVDLKDLSRMQLTDFIKSLSAGDTV